MFYDDSRALIIICDISYISVFALTDTFAILVLCWSWGKTTVLIGLSKSSHPVWKIMLSESADSSVPEPCWADTWGLPEPDSGRSIFWGNHYRSLYVDHPWLILPLQLVSLKLFPHGAGANPATRAAGAAGSSVLCHRLTERCWLTTWINTVGSMISQTPACVIISVSLSLILTFSHIFSLIINIRAESFANGHLFHVALIRHKSSCPPLGVVTKWLIKKGLCLV